MARSSRVDISVEPRRSRRGRRIVLRVLAALVVLVVLAGGAAIWASRSLPGIVAAQIGRLTNTRVEAGAFGFRLDGSISIDGLVIRPQYEDPNSDNAILRARNVHVRVSRRSLVLFAPRVTELRLEDFALDAQWNVDTGRWNVEGLRFNRSGRREGFVIPAIELVRGKVRCCKVSGGNAEVVMSVPVEARLGKGLAHQGYGFEIKTSKLSGGHGESHLSGYWRPGELAMAGGLSSTDIPSLEWAWAVDVLAAQLSYEKNGDYVLDLHAKDVHGKQVPEVTVLQWISPGGAAGSGALASIQRFFDRYRPTGTVGSITLEVRGNLKKLKDSEVQGTLVCDDVSVCDSRFPYPLDHLTGEIDFTRSSLTLKQLAGKHGDVDVHIDGWRSGRGVERQYRYNITTDNMILDEALYQALRPGQKRMWDLFRPSGRVAADYWLVRTSPTDKRMYLSVDLQGVDSTFREFPYPLTGLTGELYIDNDSAIATCLVSESGTRRIVVNGKATGYGTGRPIYYASVDANNVPLDATLERALPASYRQSYRSMEANGTADVQARAFSEGDANEAPRIRYVADVAFRSKSLKLEDPPIVLSDVVAKLAVSPELLDVQRLDGRYGQSRVVVTGGIGLGREGKSRQYDMKVTAQEIPVDGSTIALLAKPLAEQLSAFRPQGCVNLDIDVKTSEGNKPKPHSVHVDCLGLKIDHERFPYPLQDVRGTILLAGDSLALKDITASPADPCQSQPSARVCIDGTVELGEGGPAGACFAIQTRDMSLTKSLGEALPKVLSGLYRGLSPQGPFDLDVTNLRASRVGSDQMLVEFAARATLQGCRLSVSGADAELFGQVATDGSYHTKQGLLSGRTRLAAERLVVKGRTISGLTAEALYDPNARVWSAGSILGDCYRGKVLGNLQVAVADAGAPEYRLQVALNRVDVQPFLRAGEEPDKTVQPSAPVTVSPSSPDPLHGGAGEEPYSGGVMEAWMSLQGRCGDPASRRGACQAAVANMRVGKVSLLVNLLSVLRLSEPTNYVFDQMRIDSYIRQDTLLIRTLDMSGRNAAFTGAGTMSLPTGRLNLTLTARGQRISATEPSILQALTEGLGGAVVRVEVTGSAAAPHIETKTLPLIEDSLKILGTPE
ncbi:MAG: hypothetical protein KBE65_04775 [Phycisphaerae bacterium]|nr:hypothetical protein [Phycisphaerae bacterium]